MERFPLLAMAYGALREGGAACIVLNAANEVAVEAFLAGSIPYLGIARVCREALERCSPPAPRDEGDILEADRQARALARELAARGA